MTFRAAHFNWLIYRNGEVMLMVGVAAGCVSYQPTARWLYSFRLYLGVCKVEMLWRTGEPIKP